MSKNFTYNLVMNGSASEPVTGVATGYKYISIINATDNTITIYKRRVTSGSPSDQLGLILPYTAQSYPVDNVQDLTFSYIDGGASDPKIATVIFSDDNLGYSGSLGTTVTGNVGIISDSVGLAREAQLPAALGGAGGVKTEIVSSVEVEVKNDAGNPLSVSAAQLPAALGSLGLLVEVAGIDAVPIVGTHGNLANATAIGAGGVSNSVDTHYTKQLSIFGHVDGATTLTLQLSQDGVNWYSTGNTQIPASASDFSFTSLTVAARYVRLSSSNAITLTATCAGKM